MASVDMGGTASENHKGGHDIDVKGIAKVGNETLGAGVGVFAKGNDKHGPITTGAMAEISSNGHGLGIQHANTHGGNKLVAENLRINAFNNDNHNLDLNAFHGRTVQPNGLKYDSVGANASWNHVQGHSASLELTKIPKFGISTVQANASANLWTSPNQASSFGLNAFGSQHIAGPYRGQKDFGAGMGFTHRF
ncbi:attacin-A [Stomoxys calcitrans]|uniref:Attacin C-terminal domain-containing protein n=1 Tax=Stomoxys calcitrans TaxID=35570 RepID=A0A1I8PHC1_STOCA|nr:attacin-A [Stomoxys calcitrans]